MLQRAVLRHAACCAVQVGDIESMPFIEALRQFQFRVGPGE